MIASLALHLDSKHINYYNVNGDSMKINSIYFSPCGETKKVADYYSRNLPNSSIFSITSYQERKNLLLDPCDLLILSIPTYAEDIPKIIIPILKTIKGNHAIINITYGSISAGKTLSSVTKVFKHHNIKIIGAAIIPTKHCYLPKELLYDFQPLNQLIQKVNNKDFSSVILPKEKKHILANLFPKLRHQIVIKKPQINHQLCTKCRICIENCPTNAINDNYNINNKCIRCMGCITKCPEQAITTSIHPILRRYLRKGYDKKKEIILYK